tara:strand:+ start:6743 stop:10252 length:3510 start_codon:yes stop_codon:yes gene_type:complete
MKKYLIYGLGLILVFTISCTRSASDKNGAQVVIQIPTSSQLQAKLQNISANNYVNKLIQKSSLQTMSSDPAPTGFEGTRPLNCFAVALSGPIEALRRNHCYKKATTLGAPLSFYVGPLSKIVGTGAQIVMEDLESGPGRIFRLVGFHSKSGDCPALETSHDNYGNGYLMAETGAINLEAGKTMTIQMNMTFDTDKFIDRCDGPDFPEGNGGGSGDNPATRLVIKKDFFPVNQIVESTCQAVDIVGQNAYSDYASVKSATTFKLLGNGSALTMYSTYENCTTNSSVSELTFIAGQDRKQVWFMAPSKNAATYLDLDISFGSNPDALSSGALVGVQVRSYDEKSFEIYAPQRILAEGCYEIKVDAKYMNNSIYSAHYSPASISVTNGSLYSDSSCTTQTTSVNFSTGKSSSPIYLKTAASFGTKVSIVASYSGFIDGRKTIEVGSGSQTLANIEVRHSNQTIIGECVNASVTFLNENYTAIVIPAAVILNFSGGGSTANFFSDQYCGANSNGVQVASAGVSSTEFSFSPLTYGIQSIQLTTTGVSAYSMNYFANYRYKLSVYANSYSMAPGTCVGATIYTQYQNGYSAYLNTATAVSVTTPFPMYSDSSCKNSLGNVATIPANSNMVAVFFQPDNLTPIAIDGNIVFQAPGLSQTNISFNVGSRPSLATVWGLSAHKVASNFPLDLKLLMIPFTGLPPFVITKTAGTGVLNGDIYFPVVAETAAFTVADNSGVSFNFTAQTVQSVFANNFTAQQLPAGYSFTRASGGKYYDASGTLVDASAGTPRFDRNPDPSTSYSSLGLLIEPASTNLVVYSSYMSAGNWNKSFSNIASSSVIQDPAGNSYSDVIAWNNPTYTNMAYASSQAVAPSPGSVYSGSVFVKKDTARFVGMKIHEYGGSYGYSGVVLDLDTGNVVGMYDPWSGDVSSNFGVQKLKNGWFRIWTNYMAKGGSGIQLYLYPVYHGGSTLSPNRDNTVSGQTYFWGAQLEIGESATSYIATSGAAASRNADVFSVDISSGAPSYASATESSIRFEYSRPEGSRPNAGALFAVCGSNCASERFGANVYYGDAVGFEMLSVGGSEYYTLYSSGFAAVKGINKIAMSFSSSSSYGFNWALNSSAGTNAATYITNHPTLSGGRMYFGSDYNGLNQSTIHLRSYELWIDKISGPGLKTMTK